MQITKQKVLSSNAVRGFVESGGTIQYVPQFDESGSMIWFLNGVDQYGHEIPVVIGRTGDLKIFRSANAVISYHLSLYPNVREITVPVIPRNQTRNQA